MMPQKTLFPAFSIQAFGCWIQSIWLVTYRVLEEILMAKGLVQCHFLWSDKLKTKTMRVKLQPLLEDAWNLWRITGGCRWFVANHCRSQCPSMALASYTGSVRQCRELETIMAGVQWRRYNRSDMHEDYIWIHMTYILDIWSYWSDGLRSRYFFAKLPCSFICCLKILGELTCWRVVPIR